MLLFSSIFPLKIRILLFYDQDLICLTVFFVLMSEAGLQQHCSTVCREPGLKTVYPRLWRQCVVSCIRHVVVDIKEVAPSGDWQLHLSGPEILSPVPVGEPCGITNTLFLPIKRISHYCDPAWLPDDLLFTNSVAINIATCVYIAVRGSAQTLIKRKMGIMEFFSVTSPTERTRFRRTIE